MFKLSLLLILLFFTIPNAIFARIYLGTEQDKLPILTGLSKEKGLLTTIKKGQGVIKVYFDTKNHQIYLLMRDGNNQYLQLNSKKISDSFKKILSFSFLSHIQKPLYTVQNKEGKEQLFIGNEGSAIFDKIGNIASSEKDDFIAFQAAKDQKAFVVYNNVVGKLYDAIGNLYMSNSGSYIYSAQESKISLLVHDGRELKDFEHYGLYRIANKTNDLFYTALKEDKWYLFKNHAPISEGYSEISSLDINEDGTIFLMSVKKDEEYFIDYNNTLSPAYSKTFSPILSKDGKHYAYGIIKHKKGAYITNGEESAYYDDLFGITFSDDGSDYVYWALKNGKWILVVNGKEGDSYSEILSAPVLSSDGNKICFWVQYQGRFILAVRDFEKTLYYEKLLTFKFDKENNLYLIEHLDRNLFYTLE